MSEGGPEAAVTSDRPGTAAIERPADQTWFQAVANRRTEAAAVNATANGSQVSTMRAMSQRIARSQSVPPL
jgi:hypothetical protein